MRGARAERLSAAPRDRPPRPRSPRCLARWTGLKFLEKVVQLFKVTVSFPLRGARLGARVAALPQSPLGEGCAGDPDITSCVRRGVEQTFWLLQTPSEWGEGTRGGSLVPWPPNESIEKREFLTPTPVC